MGLGVVSKNLWHAPHTAALGACGLEIGIFLAAAEVVIAPWASVVREQFEHVALANEPAEELREYAERDEDVQRADR